jgi:hypothetical protein
MEERKRKAIVLVVSSWFSILGMDLPSVRLFTDIDIECK